MPKIVNKVKTKLTQGTWQITLVVYTVLCCTGTAVVSDACLNKAMAATNPLSFFCLSIMYTCGRSIIMLRQLPKNTKI